MSIGIATISKSSIQDKIEEALRIQEFDEVYKKYKEQPKYVHYYQNKVVEVEFE